MPDRWAGARHAGQKDRLFARVLLLHGELMAGDKGSMLIELAGCWTTVLVLTGLALWWPRGDLRLAGYVYPRLHLKGRLWWKDVHAVSGVWVSFLVIALLLTGLPWAKSWGGHFKFLRSSLAAVTVIPDWPKGSSSEKEAIASRNAAHEAAASEGGSAGGHHRHHGNAEAEKAPPRFCARAAQMPVAPDAYAAINVLLPAVERLPLAHPVQILPPVKKGVSWFARSNAQNRTLQDRDTLDPTSGAVQRHEASSARPLVDRVVSMGTAYHEGQLFGFVSQIVGLLTAVGAATLSVSSVVMWWSRRSTGVLDAPVATQYPALAPVLIALIAVLAIAFPMLAVCIVALMLLERLIFRHSPQISRWLGLSLPHDSAA